MQTLEGISVASSATGVFLCQGTSVKSPVREQGIRVLRIRIRSGQGLYGSMAASRSEPLDVTLLASPAFADPESEVLRLLDNQGSSLYRFCRMTLGGADEADDVGTGDLPEAPAASLRGWRSREPASMAVHGRGQRVPRPIAVAAALAAVAGGAGSPDGRNS